MNKDKLKWATFGLALGIIGGGIGAAGANKWSSGVTRFETVQARRIAISNDAGRTVAMLTAAPDGEGGALFISNTAEKLVAALGAHPDGGRLLIYNRAGEQIAVIGAHPDGDAGLDIRNKAGEPVASLP